eukprot:4283004-Pleurochrysis_carterae.AAC.2
MTRLSRVAAAQPQAAERLCVDSSVVGHRRRRLRQANRMVRSEHGRSLLEAPLDAVLALSLIHISEPTRRTPI